MKLHKRGGRREGAGRKRTLTDIELWAVGARCEALLRSAKLERLHRAKAQATCNVSEIWKEADSIPVPDRAQWMQSEAFEDYQEEVRIALRADAGMKEAPLIDDTDDLDAYIDSHESYEDQDPPRLIAIIATRPKGLSKKIIAQVSMEETIRRGQPISPRRVKAAWDAFRALEKDILSSSV
jgi:hypothetical protein